MNQAIKRWYKTEDDTGNAKSNVYHNGYVTKWTVKRVIAKKMIDEINRRIGGAKDYLSKFHSTVAEIEKELSDEQRQEYSDMAEEYNRTSPPQEWQTA